MGDTKKKFVRKSPVEPKKQQPEAPIRPGAAYEQMTYEELLHAQKVMQESLDECLGWECRLSIAFYRQQIATLGEILERRKEVNHEPA